MAEVGWVGFARMPLRVVAAVLLAYRAKFCKPLFTPPPLLAVLGVMRFKEGTLPEAQVRLREPAWALPAGADPPPLYHCMRRLHEGAAVLAQAVERGAWQGTRGPCPVAVDATGLAPGALSTCFVTSTRLRRGS